MALSSTFSSSSSVIFPCFLNLHIIMHPDNDSTKLSIPNPTNAMLPANNPANIDAIPSNTLYPTVKYDSKSAFL